MRLLVGSGAPCDDLGRDDLVALHAHPDRVAVGVDINATHHRSATSGIVTGTATPAHLGRTSATWEIVVTDERGKRLCTSRITCALVPKEKLGM